MKDLFSAKRIKSFFITLFSLVITAFIAVVATPEWSAFLVEVKAWAGSLGLSAASVAVIGVFVAEIWKNWLNKRMAKAAGYNKVAAASNMGVDLY